MRWISGIVRRIDGDAAASIDLDAVVASFRDDPREADAALKALDSEHRRLIRQRANLQKRLSRFSAARVRDIARSGPQLGPIQLQTDMRIRDDAGQDANLSLQESDLEARIREVERAMAEARRVTQAR